MLFFIIITVYVMHSLNIQPIFDASGVCENVQLVPACYSERERERERETEIETEIGRQRERERERE